MILINLRSYKSVQVEAAGSSRCNAFKLLTHTKSVIWDLSLMPWSRSRKLRSRSANVQTHDPRENMSQGAPTTPVILGWGCAAHPCGICSIQTCMCACASCHQLSITHLMKTPKHKRKPKCSQQLALSLFCTAVTLCQPISTERLFFKNFVHIWTQQLCSAECGPR